MVSAAFGALGAIILVLVAPFTTAAAVAFPPVYALVAGVHSVLPFLARRLLGLPLGATLVAGFVGILSSASTPLGFLIVVPLLAGAVPFDLTLLVWGRIRGREPWTAVAVAALASALVLFFVSLPVFSPEDLRPVIVVGALVGRILGQLIAAALAAVLAVRIRAAGIVRSPTSRP